MTVNVLMMSPGFPEDLAFFTQGLAEVGARVYGIGDQPLGALRLADARSGRLVIHHDGHPEEPEGQLVLDFESAPEPALARIPPPSPRAPLDGAGCGGTAPPSFAPGAWPAADPGAPGAATPSSAPSARESGNCTYRTNTARPHVRR